MAIRRKVFTVTEINNYTRELLKNDFLLSGKISISGEIGNITSSKGSFYFNLKDDEGQISVKFFSSYADKCTVALKTGLKIVCDGCVDLYGGRGEYCFKAVSIEPAGSGEIYGDYLKLKSKLQSEGLFDLDRKRPIPEFPSKIGVVTSETGAVIHDIITTVRQRAPWVSIVLAPAIVQGPSAPKSMMSALSLLNAYGGIDTVIIGRGGGSFEDLNCFNDEELVRMAASFPIPIIAAVGHESDVTLIELASDMRAATPTAAASAAVPDSAAMLRDLKSKDSLCSEFMERRLKECHDRLKLMGSHIIALRPSARIEAMMRMLEGVGERLDRNFEVIFSGVRHSLDKIEGIMRERNPYRPLEKGYAFVTDSSGHIVKSVSELSVGESISLKLSDGSASASVTDCVQDKWGYANYEGK